MDRPPLEVADLVRAAGDAFIERSRKWISWKHVKVLLAIARCRTAMLGGHLDECTRCGHRAISYSSCRNRHCPKCQTGARERWLEKRRRELLPTQYVHVVFTLPRQLAPLTLQNKKVVYDLLFRTSAETLLEIARDPQHLGAEIGSFSVLHSWVRNSNFTHMCIAWCRPVDFLPIARVGSSHATRSFFMSRCSAEFFAQVRRGTPARVSGRRGQFSRRLAAPHSAENLCRVAETTISKGLGGLRGTTVRRPGACAPLSGPLHPSCSHLQSSTGLVC